MDDILMIRGSGVLDSEPEKRTFGDDGVALDMSLIATTGAGSEHENQVPFRLSAVGSNSVNRFDGRYVKGQVVSFNGYLSHRINSMDDGSASSSLDVRLIAMRALGDDDQDDTLIVDGTGVLVSDPVKRRVRGDDFALNFRVRVVTGVGTPYERTMFLSPVVFGRRVERYDNRFASGMGVVFSGFLDRRIFERRDGGQGVNLDVRLNSLMALDRNV